MNKYVALLRGINSGKNPNTKMVDLCKLFEDLGFENVKSVIASGNIIFSTSENNVSKLEKLIEKKFSDRFGFLSTVILRSEKEIAEIIEQDPFKNQVKSKTIKANVSFCRELDEASIKLPEKHTGYQIILMENNNVFSIVDLNNARSPDLMKFLDEQLGKIVTTRTFETVKKIYSKFD